MTPSPEFDRRIAAWLDDGRPTRAPEHLLGDSLALTGRTHPRPAWRIPERWIPMSVQTWFRAAPRAVLIAVAMILVTVLAATALAVGSLTSPAPPSMGPALNGLIAYDAEGDIWVMNPDGSGQRQLTSGPALDIEATWSPDGSRLAYWSVIDPAQPSGPADPSSDDGEVFERGVASLKIIGLDGSDPVTLVADLKLEYPFTMPVSWSPDSRRMAYSYLEQGRPVIDTISIDDRRPVRVATGRSPSWSPDGSRIAYVENGPVARIMVIETAHPETPIRIGDIGDGWDASAWPQWSPDGRFVTYHTNRDSAQDIAVVDVQTGESQFIGNKSNEYWPTFSPDGKRIVFNRAIGSGETHYVLVDPDGGNAVTLDTQTVWASLPAAWAPDGTLVAGVRGNDRGGITLYLLDPTSELPPLMIDVPTDWMGVSWQRLGSPAATPDDPLVGTAWRLRSASMGYLVRAPEGEPAILTLEATEYLFTAYSCDPHSGPYVHEGDRLTFAVAETRHMSCGRIYETVFVRDLSKVTSYVLADDKLMLLDATARVLMNFEPLV
jgi:TolB protein